MCKNEGVFPLVCPICQRIVGVINVAGFMAMVAAEDIYICSECMTRPEPYVEFVLKGIGPEDWANLTADVALKSTVLPAADFNHPIPVATYAGQIVELL